MTDTLIPEGFRKLDVTDDFVGLIGPLWYKAEGERLRIGLPLTLAQLVAATLCVLWMLR